MKKSIIRIASFILILGIILWKVNSILSFKFADGNSILADFYRLEKNTVDVVTIGSSHAYANFNCGVLWDEYGIASYDLASSMQPTWNSYYYLKEALKTQQPELIVLEGFGTSFDIDYSNDSRIVKNTYSMKWSRDKIEAITVSATEERKQEFLLDYARYHNRYATLNRGDFFPESEYLDSNNYWHYMDTMGQYLFDQFRRMEIMDVSKIHEPEELNEKAEEYYRKTIELAQENNIPIVVIVAPYALTEEDQRRFLRAEEIAEEYGVKFLNTNLLLDEIGINTARDYHDDVHLTVQGSRKFSLYIGQYLKENFEITDRRGDERYGAWDRCAAYTEQFRKNMILKNATSLDKIAKRLSNQNYRLLISLDGNADAEDEVIGDFLSQQGIDPASSNVMWMKEGKSMIWEFDGEEAKQYMSTKLHDICMKRVPEGDGIYSNKIIVDKKEYRKVDNGLNVVVFDTLTDRVADSFGIDSDNNYSIVRI